MTAINFDSFDANFFDGIKVAAKADKSAEAARAAVVDRIIAEVGHETGCAMLGAAYAKTLEGVERDKAEQFRRSVRHSIALGLFYKQPATLKLAMLNGAIEAAPEDKDAFRAASKTVDGFIFSMQRAIRNRFASTPEGKAAAEKAKKEKASKASTSGNAEGETEATARPATDAEIINAALAVLNKVKAKLPRGAKGKAVREAHNAAWAYLQAVARSMVEPEKKAA